MLININNQDGDIHYLFNIGKITKNEYDFLNNDKVSMNKHWNDLKEGKGEIFNT